MLPDQLMDADDFLSRCGYCGQHWNNKNCPDITRIDSKEYLLFHCDTGHSHTVTLDITDSKHRGWVEDQILAKRAAPWKQKASMTLEKKLRGKYLDMIAKKK